MAEHPRLQWIAICAAVAIAATLAVSGTRAKAALEPPDAPLDFRLAGRVDHRLTLAWQAPAGPTPDLYVIEGGLTPGDVLASIPVTASQTVVDLDVPSGTFFIRIHAIAGGERSLPSNEIMVTVGAGALQSPPTAPSALLGLADGDTLHLSWTLHPDRGAIAAVLLQVSGPVSGTLALGPVESFTFSGVPSGAYTFAVVATNDAGESLPSNAVTLDFPGTCSGPPQPPTGFRSWRTGTHLFIGWDPPVAGPAVSRYRVRVDGTFTVAFETTERLVSAPAPDGTYIVHIDAVNACGTSAPAAAIDWTVAVRQEKDLAVYWPAEPGHVYRVYWSTSPGALDAPTPALPSIDVSGSPARVPVDDSAAAWHFRVFEVSGPVATGGSPRTMVPTFAVRDYLSWPGNTAPVLWDVNGDGCLDLLGAWGRCDGSFERYDLAAIGLGHFTAGGARKDSRFADFTGDGIVDVFTNVYLSADNPVAESVLHVGRPDGTFAEDPAVTALGVRGWGETILAADFDNDGDLDIFNPQYTHRGDGGQNWLLINDGAGHFVDVAAAAGVAQNAFDPPEGAQAIDWNDDGFLDILVGSQLFLNNGNLTFTDISGAINLPMRFDEGLKLFDVDLDGDLDLVHNNTFLTKLYRNVNGRFDGGVDVDGSEQGLTAAFGINTCDVNGDGYEDVVLPSNEVSTNQGLPRVLMNVRGSLVRSDLGGTPVTNHLVACADLDGSGMPDIVSRWTVPGFAPSSVPVALVQYRTYLSQAPRTPGITLRVVDASGRKNQQGRPVRLRPRSQPAVTLVREVEAGSGYLSQNGYDLLVGAPWAGPYDVEVRFADRVVTATAMPGDVLTIRADGSVAAGLH